jgi:glutamine amidotransferase
MTESMANIAVVDTGLSNLASVEAAFRRIGIEIRRTADPLVVREADGVELPGVGHFAEGMRRLRAADLVGAIRERIDADRPTLAICLGMQLLAERSDEAPGVVGIGVIPGSVRRLPPARIRPHLGWNMVRAATGSREPRMLVEDGAAAFANGFALDAAPEGWATAWSDDHGSFVAAVERGCVLACQFHPEISGRWGAALLGAWIRGGRTPAGRTEVPTCC